jgi:hypothetical protein
VKSIDPVLSQREQLDEFPKLLPALCVRRSMGDTVPQRLDTFEIGPTWCVDGAQLD